jgi:hypothetical protein
MNQLKTAQQNYLAGAVIKNFEDGFAIMPFVDRGHFWLFVYSSFDCSGWQEVKFFGSICRQEITWCNEFSKPLEIGQLPSCKNCERIVAELKKENDHAASCH